MTTTWTNYVERSRERPDAMRRRAEASNIALERTAGSDSLAAASETIHAGQTDVLREIRSLTRGGADYSFECIGKPDTIRQSVDCTRVGGISVITGGVPEVKLDGIGLLFKTIRGNHQGSSIPAIFIPLLIDMWTRGDFPFDRLISQTYTLHDINQAIIDMERGDVVKPVIRY